MTSKFRFIVAILSFVLLSAGNASARLGETLDQLVTRYGPPLGRLPETPKTFHKGNWIIIVSLLNGISVGEKFQKPGGPTADEIAQLLAINAQDQHWTLKQNGPTFWGSLIPVPGTPSKTWMRDDGAMAMLTTGLPIYLNIESKELLDQEAAAKAAQDKAKQINTQGF
jgi:hypothetical protein